MMMKFKSIRTFVIATLRASPAFVLYSSLSHRPTTFCNSFLYVLGTVSIRSFVWHTF